MYKVLIVDDETMEVNALLRIVSGHLAGQCEVSTAHNGKGAIATAESIHADIVLMDIEMPGINGLDAAREIKAMFPRCRIIMVSAYERFQYAQLAMSLGAEDYLLKPVDNAELFRLLDKAVADIDNDRAEEARRVALDQLAQEQFVLSVISGYSSESSLASQLRELEIPFTHGFFCIICTPDHDSAEALHALVKPTMPTGDNGQVLAYEYDDQLLLALLLHESYWSERDIQQTMSRWIQEVRAQSGVQLFASIGRIVTDLSDLQRSYDQAAEMVSLCTPQYPVQILLEDESRNRQHRGLERKLYNCLLERDIDAAIRCADTMLDTLFFALGQSDAVLRATRSLLERVARRLQDDARMPDDLADGLLLSEGDRLSQQEMSIRIRSLLAEWVQTLDTQPADRMQRIRAEIERYIQGHYAEDLSIKQVAKAMHYSEPYFSKLFSRCFHRNFVTYLTDIRMQVARDMLANSMANVRAVSGAVGFADANYFAKVFRKAYGISPSEYRRLSFAQDDAPADRGKQAR